MGEGEGKRETRGEAVRGESWNGGGGFEFKVVIKVGVGAIE